MPCNDMGAYCHGGVPLPGGIIDDDDLSEAAVVVDFLGFTLADCVLVSTFPFS